MKLEKLNGKSYQLINDGGARFQIRSTRPKRPSSTYTIKYWKNYYRLTFETLQDIDTFRAGVLGSSDDISTIWTDDDKTYDYISKTYFNGKHVRQIGRGFGIYSMGQTYSFDSGKCCIALLVDEEAIDITKPLPTEKKMWAEQKEIDDKLRKAADEYRTRIAKTHEDEYSKSKENDKATEFNSNIKKRNSYRVSLFLLTVLPGSLQVFLYVLESFLRLRRYQINHPQPLSSYVS